MIFSNKILDPGQNSEKVGVFVGLVCASCQLPEIEVACFGFRFMGLSDFCARASMDRDSLSHANRAGSSGNAPARSDNHGGWIKNRAASKAVGLFLSNSAAAVNRAGVTAKGFDWLSVSRMIHQKLRAIPILEIFEAKAVRIGLLLQPAQTLLESP